MSLISRFSICPMCGKELIKINIINEEGQIALCSDSGCRVTLTDTSIYIMGIERYARLQDELASISSDIFKNKDRYFLLLSEKLDKPMLSLLTNKPIENRRNKLNIIKAKNKDEAIKLFRDMTNISKLNIDRIVEVYINYD